MIYTKKLNFIRMLTIAALVLLPKSASAVSGDYTCYLADPAHDNSVNTTALLPPFNKQWSINIAGIDSSPIIADGMVFLTFENSNTNNEPALEAFNSATGARVWGPIAISTQFGEASIAYDAGSVFLLTADPTLQAYVAKTGKLKWSVSPPSQFIFGFTPTAMGGRVFVGGDSIFAYSEANGSLDWKYTAAGGDSSVAVADGSVFADYGAGQCYGLNASTGSLIWRLNDDLDGGGGSAPLYLAGSLRQQPLRPRRIPAEFWFHGTSSKCANGRAWRLLSRE